MKREDLKRGPVRLIARKTFAKPDLIKVGSGDRTLVVKDVGELNCRLEVGTFESQFGWKIC